MKSPARIGKQDFLPRHAAPQKIRPLPSKKQPKAELYWTDELAKKVEDDLWNRLPFGQMLRLEFRDLEHVVEVYVASMGELQIAREQGQAFFREMCRANFELRCPDGVETSARESIARQEMAEFEKSIKLPAMRLDDTLRAKLACVDLATATRKLKQSLRQQTHNFVQQFFAACNKAAADEIIGVIEWEKEFVACVLHDFRRVIVAEATTEQTRAGKKKIERLADRHGFAKVTEKIKVQTRTAYTVRHAWHEVHLISAKRHPLNLCPVPIPDSHRALVEAAPVWLRPFVEVVDGTRIYERVVEFDRKKKTHEVDEEFDREKLVFVGDPALTLGKFVLSVWGSPVPQSEKTSATSWQSSPILSPFVLLVLMIFLAGAVITFGAVPGLIVWLMGSLGIAIVSIPIEDKKPDYGTCLAWGLLSLVALGVAACGWWAAIPGGQKISAAGAVLAAVAAIYAIARFSAELPKKPAGPDHQA